jgi:hypothetical protein
MRFRSFLRVLALIVVCFSGFCFAEAESFSGVLLPGQGGTDFRLRGMHGTIGLEFADDMRVGLDGSWRYFRLDERTLQLNAVSFPMAEWKSQVQEISLPAEAYVWVEYSDVSKWESEKKRGRIRKISGLFFCKQAEHLPTADEPWLMGRVAGVVKGHKDSRFVYYSTEVEGKVIKFRAGDAKLFGLKGRKDIKAFEQYATVTGELDGEMLQVSEIVIQPVGDPFAYFDKKLPNYMYVGDSISRGYGGELRKALAGKVNLYHPPVNCGPSSKGVAEIDQWLGGHEIAERQWDVISFNHGHWDVTRETKVQYQANLEHIINRLKNTGAELIFVTTCPAPLGMMPDVELTESRDRVERNGAGAMEQFINPWALEVVARHPEIWVCDQWKVVKELEASVYAQWWKADKIHFKAPENVPLAKALAETANKALANPRRKGAKNIAPKTDVNFMGVKVHVVEKSLER